MSTSSDTVQILGLIFNIKPFIIVKFYFYCFLSFPSNIFIVLETVKNLLLENEPLVKASYHELLRQAQQSGLLDKAGRLVFSGNGFTINLIPQALFFLGWLAGKTFGIYNIILILYLLIFSVLAFLIYGLSDEYSNAQAYATGYDYSSKITL